MTWLVHHTGSVNESLTTKAFLTATFRQQQETAVKSVPNSEEVWHSKNALRHWE